MDIEIKGLYAARDRLTKEIEAAIKNLPEKQDLDAVNRLIMRLESVKKSSDGPPDRDAIMESVVSFFRHNDNKKSKMDEIIEWLEEHGITIEGKRSGVSVAAMMTKTAKWKDRFDCDDEGYWTLND